MSESFTASEQLGYLRRAAEEHSREMRELKDIIRVQGKDSANARAEMLDRLEEVERKVQLFEPLASDMNRWRERGLGALMVLGFFISGVTALLTAFWTKILAWAGYSA